MDYKIDSYNFMKNIRVIEDGVKFYKEKILKRLKTEDYIKLSDEFNGLSNYEINCNNQEVERELDKFTERLSDFMAYQEALHDMVIEGKLIPIKITNMSSCGNFNIRIQYSIRNGMSTLKGYKDIGIPILENNTFMLKPSLKGKLS